MRVQPPRPETLQHEPARNELCERTGRSGFLAEHHIYASKGAVVWVYTQKCGVCLVCTMVCTQK